MGSQRLRALLSHQRDAGRLSPIGHIPTRINPAVAYCHASVVGLRPNPDATPCQRCVKNKAKHV